MSAYDGLCPDCREINCECPDSKGHEMSGREELLALSAKATHDYVAWVEGRMSQTQFVVDMAQHLLDLKTIALTRPQPADGGGGERLRYVLGRVLFDRYGACLPCGNTKIDEAMRNDSIRHIDAAIAAQAGEGN